MIVLITGASHTGKTVLAQKLLERYRFPYLSIDHLKMGLIRSGNTNLTPSDDAALTDYLWPIVREMIKTAIENAQNLIVEGVYIPFDWRNDFDDAYLKEIRYKCLFCRKATFTIILTKLKHMPARLRNGLTIHGALKSRCLRKTNIILRCAGNTGVIIP